MGQQFDRANEAGDSGSKRSPLYSNEAMYGLRHVDLIGRLAEGLDSPQRARPAQGNGITHLDVANIWDAQGEPINEQGPASGKDLHPSGPLTPGDHQESLTVQGRQRRYEIHVPPNYDGSKPIPVMYVMPGVGGHIDQMKHETGLNREADEKGFAVVYIEALDKPFPGTFGLGSATSWNLDHGSLTEKVAGYDDLNYIKAVDKEVSKALNVQNDAKYLTGFSEGGGAAQYVAESMPGVFAGVASVHGTHLESDPKPRTGDPTAFVSIIGDDDNMLPISGGHGIGEGWRPMKGFMTGTLGKVSESEPLQQKEVWAEANGCQAPKIKDDGKDKVTTYTCQGGPVTEIIRLGGMHAWDGLGQNPNNYITGKPDYGWWLVGEPNPKWNTSADVVKALMGFRKPDHPQM